MKTLADVQKELDARGIRIVHITFGPGARKAGYNKVAKDTVDFFRAYLNGEFTVVTKIDKDDL